MGHIHLGVLPKSKKWQEVVELLASGATDESVVAASVRAAENDLAGAARNPVFVEAVRLMAMVPVAARSEDFGHALRELNVPSGNSPDLFSLVSAVGQRLDDVAATRSKRDDFGELARRALLSTLMANLGDRVPRLLAATPADVQQAARGLASPNEFAVHARGFFTRLLGETLRYWLDRTLSDHVADGLRFSHAGNRAQFDIALMQFSSEATFIIREFSAGWFSKTLYRDGLITSGTAQAYGAVAFRKIREELRLKHEADD